MDSLCTAAARALRSGDALGALKRIALRDDADALALRGVALAQLGDLTRAKQLLSRAIRAFGPREVVARARCLVARAEVALAARDPVSSGDARSLDAAARALEQRGDRENALHARLIVARRMLLLGRVDRAETSLRAIDLDGAPVALAAIAFLARADVAIRHVRAAEARRALELATRAAGIACIPALAAEIHAAFAALASPAARFREGDTDALVTLDAIETLFASDAFVVDACRRAVRAGGRVVALARRPVLFALLRMLAAASPASATRASLIESAFGARRQNESHRARLRVEMGRLRRELEGMAAVTATADGFTLRPEHTSRVVVVAPPIDDDDAALVALLADGQSWSTSALALALSRSQRTVQRALSGLVASSRVRSFGEGRARRWLAPAASGFATSLLLPTAVDSDDHHASRARSP